MELQRNQNTISKSQVEKESLTDCQKMLEIHRLQQIRMIKRLLNVYQLYNITWNNDHFCSFLHQKILNWYNIRMEYDTVAIPHIPSSFRSSTSKLYMYVCSGQYL